MEERKLLENFLGSKIAAILIGFGVWQITDEVIKGLTVLVALIFLIPLLVQNLHMRD